MSRPRFESGPGPSQRQLRVGELIRRALADIFARGNLHDPELARVSITVGEVRASSDLRSAKVYVLPLGGLNADETVEALNRSKPEIRRLVSKSVNLKFSPDLRFLPDRLYDQMDETSRLLGQDSVRRDTSGTSDEMG